MASAVKESDSLPDMRTIGVTTLISDSGMIRYKIITAEWLIYSHRNPPFWAFEKGIYLEKFDSIFHVDASIKADTAYYYEPKNCGNCVEMYISKASEVTNSTPN